MIVSKDCGMVGRATLHVVKGAGVALCATGLLSIQPAAAQVKVPNTPSQRPPEGYVVDNPNRIFGDDSPVFAALGAFGALGLNISAGLDSEYTDNLARVSGDDVPSRFKSKDDFIFRPTVTVGAERGVGRARVFANGSVSRVLHANNTHRNTNRYSIGGGTALSVGTLCGLNLQGGWSRRDAQAGLFEDSYPSIQTSSTYGGGLSCQTLNGISGSVSYNRASTRHSSLNDAPNNRRFADVDSRQIAASLGYALGRRAQLGVQGSWAENEYPNQILLDGTENSNKIEAYSVYGLYKLGTMFTVNGSLGQSRMTSGVDGTRGFKGTTWGAGLSYSGRKMGASLSTGRSVSGGSGGRENYSINKYVTASATYQLNSRASLAAGYNHSDADYEGNDNIPETGLIGSRKSDRFNLGADYRLNRMIGLGLDFNHMRRTSNPSAFNYSVNTASLSIRANF